MSKILTIFLMVLSMSFVLASGNSGSIWTTTSQCGEDNQNINHYSIGDIVYINGANFNEGNYDWEISGLGNSNESGASCDPNQIVAGDLESVDGTGNVCFAAYLIENDDCGEYKVNFNNKKDNYRVGIPTVPEFGFYMGALTTMSAIGLFFVVRRD
jgi:hypothetical protein